jgi:hypothetical protein
MKLSKKHKKLFYKKLKKYNTSKLGKVNGKTTGQKANAPAISSSSSLLDESHMDDLHYKLPVLTVIEVNRENEVAASCSAAHPASSPSSQVLFNDYLLVSSRVKFKYLVHTLFDKAQFESKENYTILNGSFSFYFCITKKN